MDELDVTPWGFAAMRYRAVRNGFRRATTLCLVSLLWGTSTTAAIEDPSAGSLGGHATSPPARAFQWPDFGSVFLRGVPLQHEGCNTLSYGSAPDLGTRLIGRVMNGDPITRGEPSACPGSAGAPAHYDQNQSLTLVELNTSPTAHSVVYRYKVLDTSHPVLIEDGRQQIVSAYDATLAPFEGEYWVAFECALASGVTASCIGPLIMFNGRLAVDLPRTSVVVTGRCIRATPECVAASVPKLLDYHGALYLFWSELQFDNSGRARNDWALAPGTDVQQHFISVDARAARLGRKPGSGRLYVEGRSSAIVGNDASASVEVMRNVDFAQFIVVGEHVLATGSLTQGPASPDETCAMPLNHVANCYRLAFAEAESPFGPFHLIPSESHGLAAVDVHDGLPNRPALYNRFVYQPATGKTVLMGGVYYDVTSPPPQLAYTPVAMDYLWPDALLQPVCDPITRPYPDWMAHAGRCIAHRQLRSAR